MSIELQQLSKTFGGYQALKPTDLTINDGEMVALLGTSGSGKTTLLRLIAGLEQADGGRIVMHGHDVTDVPVKDRRIGFVFQHYALFKHMTVAENVAFGMRVLPRKQRPNKAARQSKAQELLDMVQLGHLGKRYPASLSGGQQQRVALARALATEPTVMLFDEPFGALDVQVRQDLRLWLKGLQRELGFTGVFVTHDQAEALDLADRIAVMQHGEIVQIDAPHTLYNQPRNRAVFEFMSEVHSWAAEARGQIVNSGMAWLKSDLPLSDGEGRFAVRNQDIVLGDYPATRTLLPVRVLAQDMLGTQYRLTLQTDSWGSAEPWHLLQPVQSMAGKTFTAGKRYYLNPRQIYWLDSEQRVTPLLRML